MHQKLTGIDVNKARAPRQTSLPLDIVVVGAGVTGLTCALALTRVGHRVLVLEKDKDWTVSPKRKCGFPVPASVSSLFSRWNLLHILDRAGITSENVWFRNLQTLHTLGEDRYDTDLVKDAGGELMLVSRGELELSILDIAEQLGAKVRMDAEVTEIGEDGRSVTLANGEVLLADMIVGASGCLSVCRKMLEEPGEDQGVDMGMAMLDAIIPRTAAEADTEVSANKELTEVNYFYGNGRQAHIYPFNETDIAFHLYVPSSGDGGGEDWNDTITSEEFAALAEDFCHPSIHKLAGLATSVSKIRIVNRPLLDEWVHDSGHMVTVGGAAHPYLPGVMQGGGMGIEDAGLLGALFAHFHFMDQIPTFLYAFEEMRQTRCKMINDVELMTMQLWTMPDGPEAEERERLFTEKSSTGRGMFDGDENMNIKLYGYNVEDAADEWWIQWGVIAERTKHAGEKPEDSQTSGVGGVSVRIKSMG
ncbi:hypothetical protein OF83DRAFT_1097209 [Amylostereum chailletii]|nr:hypothetical protein OF83DRAFT_1097209 [Amylostereum chailletii]